MKFSLHILLYVVYSVKPIRFLQSIYFLNQYLFFIIPMRSTEKPLLCQCRKERGTYYLFGNLVPKYIIYLYYFYIIFWAFLMKNILIYIILFRLKCLRSPATEQSGQRKQTTCLDLAPPKHTCKSGLNKVNLRIYIFQLYQSLYSESLYTHFSYKLV